MRRLAALLLVLAVASALTGCGGDGDGQSLPTTDEAGRWSGPPRGSADGTVAVDGFNEHVDGVDESWTRSPLLATAEFLRLDRSQAAKTSVEANSRDEGGMTRVSVTLNGLADDSIQAQRYQLTFERAGDGKVRLASARWTQRCARGRGHRTFEPKDCV